MQYLDFLSNLLLILSCVLGVSSIILFSFNKIKASLIALVTTSFILGILFATVDPFLHLWDEQFHALVSKNLIMHWWKPTLYESPVLNYEYKYWSGNHVWLHKQPLFLWQMALSQYFLGDTEIGLRFPDIIMHAILTFIVFDIGRLIKNKQVGFLAALFFTVLNFPLELLSGKMGLDHNDFAFMFYITLSFWAYFKYREAQRFFLVLIIGLLVGCAILVKWLPGLLIYLCWFLAYAFEQKKLKNIIINSKPIMVSLIITVIVFLPWQIYCYLNFPNEFKYEMFYNGAHLSTAIEGHTGDWTFYFTELSKLYGDGDLVPYLLLISLFYFIYDKKQNIHNKIIITTAIVFIYIFFTLVKTKMTGFPVIVLPLVIITLANFAVEVIELIRNKMLKKAVFLVSSIAIAFLFFNLNLVLKSHTIEYKPNENENRLQNILQTEKIKKISSLIDNRGIVLFNCGNLSIKTMYYCKGVTSYGYIPTVNECLLVKSKGYNLAILRSSALPEYIESDKTILKIDF
jgi:4-amino-4-deoxy-L-arabinose transferase